MNESDRQAIKDAIETWIHSVDPILNKQGTETQDVIDVNTIKQSMQDWIDTYIPD